jgi:hypothetical protein
MGPLGEEEGLVESVGAGEEALGEALSLAVG